jgi:hypothetical protein
MNQCIGEERHERNIWKYSKKNRGPANKTWHFKNGMWNAISSRDDTVIWWKALSSAIYFRKIIRAMHYSKTGGISLRNKELNSNDLQSILYWYNKAFRDDEDDDVEVYQKTLIKIQALAVYAQEEEEWSDKFFNRRMKW